jgi:hypothetical protein
MGASEADIAAIRTTFAQGGMSSAVVEPRRLFPAPTPHKGGKSPAG